MKERIKLNLQLFDGEGGTPSTATATGNETQQQTSTVPKSKKGALAEVKYGIQDNAEPIQVDTGSDAMDDNTTVTSDTLEARRAEFEALINGDYKDFYTEKTQDMINKRFKETKTLKSQIEKAQPILELLSSKYGAQDIDSLSKAIQEDESYYQDEAMEKGLTVDQLKEYKRLEKENAEFKEMVEKVEADKKANEILQDWTQQAEELKNIYPSFDFDTEIDNPNFTKLLRAGIPVNIAFQTIHMDEIVGGAMYQAAQKTKEKVVHGIQARNARPIENGLSSQTGVIVKNDVSKLTPADRAEIARRSAMGEQIKF